MQGQKVKIISSADENKFESDLNAYLKNYSDKDLSIQYSAVLKDPKWNEVIYTALVVIKENTNLKL